MSYLLIYSVQNVLLPTFNGVPPAFTRATPVHGLSSPGVAILLHTSCCSSVTAAPVSKSGVTSTSFTVP